MIEEKVLPELYQRVCKLLNKHSKKQGTAVCEAKVAIVPGDESRVLRLILSAEIVKGK